MGFLYFVYDSIVAKSMWRVALLSGRRPLLKANLQVSQISKVITFTSSRLRQCFLMESVATLDSERHSRHIPSSDGVRSTILLIIITCFTVIRIQLILDSSDKELIERFIHLLCVVNISLLFTFRDSDLHTVISIFEILSVDKIPFILLAVLAVFGVRAIHYILCTANLTLGYITDFP